jgi:ionotropic glutamate receptor
MHFYDQNSNSYSNILLWFSLIISLVLFHCVANSSQTTSVGVIIDVNSETGKQQIKAMQLAAQSFNNHSNNQNIILFFRKSTRNSLQAASAGNYFYLSEKHLYSFSY